MNTFLNISILVAFTSSLNTCNALPFIKRTLNKVKTRS